MDEQLYTIGQVAKMTGVPIKTIRYYSEIGLLPPARTTEARFRLYATEDIWRLHLIRVLRQMEFGLEEIRTIMAGQIPINTAIDWQLEAVERQIQQLQRIRGVLQQAKTGIDRPEEALRTLYELGIALNEQGNERGRFVTEKLQALVERANLPETWQQALREGFRWEFTGVFSEEQIAAWLEIVNMLNDSTFAEEALRFNPPTPQAQTATLELETYNRQALTIIQQAQEAALRVASAESDEVQALVQNWVRLLAVSMGRPVTEDFLRELAALVPTFYSERMQRFWTLMAQLAGREAPEDYREGFALLTKGLQWQLREQ